MLYELAPYIPNILISLTREPQVYVRQPENVRSCAGEATGYSLSYIACNMRLLRGDVNSLHEQWGERQCRR